jgi:hypothetical protein
MSFEYVEFLPKFYLILFASIGNLRTHTAIMIDPVTVEVLARERVLEENNPENHLVEKSLNNLVTTSPGKNVVLFQDKYLSNNVGRFPNKVAGLFLGKNVTLFPGKNVKQCLASPVELCQNRLVNYLVT